MIKNVYGSGRYLTTLNNGATNYMNNFSGAQGLGNTPPFPSQPSTRSIVRPLIDGFVL